MSVVLLIYAGTSAPLLFLFALCYGAANGMMTILRGTVVQDLMWVEGYGAVSGMLSLPSNIAKGVAPIATALIWTAWKGYGAVEWIILAVSLVSALAFFYAACAGRQNTIEQEYERVSSLGRQAKKIRKYSILLR